MSLLNIRAAQIELDSELYRAGRTEDGEEFIAERFFVSVTFADGSRYAHGLMLAGAECHVDPEEGIVYFEDIRPAARAKLERLIARIQAVGTIDLAHWDEITPVYGSAQWEGQGIGYQWKAAEKAGAEYGR